MNIKLNLPEAICIEKDDFLFCSVKVFLLCISSRYTNTSLAVFFYSQLRSLGEFIMIIWMEMTEFSEESLNYIPSPNCILKILSSSFSPDRSIFCSFFWVWFYGLLGVFGASTFLGFLSPPWELTASFDFLRWSHIPYFSLLNKT